MRAIELNCEFGVSLHEYDMHSVLDSGITALCREAHGSLQPSEATAADRTGRACCQQSSRRGLCWQAMEAGPFRWYQGPGAQRNCVSHRRSSSSMPSRPEGCTLSNFRVMHGPGSLGRHQALLQI